MLEVYGNDLVDGYGSILMVRNNRALNYSIIRSLRSEQRNWRVQDIEQLIYYLMELPEVGGD